MKRYLIAACLCFVALAEAPKPPSSSNTKWPTNYVSRRAEPKAANPYWKPPKPLTASELPPRPKFEPYWVRYGTTNHFANKTLTHIWIEYPPPPGPGVTNNKVKEGK